jgi:hypothetical protein
LSLSFGTACEEWAVLEAKDDDAHRHSGPYAQRRGNLQEAQVGLVDERRGVQVGIAPSVTALLAAIP